MRLGQLSAVLLRLTLQQQPQCWGALAYPAGRTCCSSRFGNQFCSPPQGSSIVEAAPLADRLRLRGKACGRFVNNARVSPAEVPCCRELAVGVCRTSNGVEGTYLRQCCNEAAIFRLDRLLWRLCRCLQSGPSILTLLHTWPGVQDVQEPSGVFAGTLLP